MADEIEDNIDLELARATYMSASDLNQVNQTAGGVANIFISTKPKVKELVERLRNVENKDNTKLFDSGDWVEVRGDDMKWAMSKIRQVQTREIPGFDPEAPGNADIAEEDIPKETFYYFEAGKKTVGRKYERYDVRAPRQGLEAIFGPRPFLWQQYALVRLESYLRLEENHAFDFMDFNIYLNARRWFREWLEHPDNSDWLEEIYRIEEPHTQELLRHHLFTPFKLMEAIRSNKDDWDFDDPNITVYSYLAVLGNGVGMVAVVVTIQILIPLVLIYNATVFGTEGGRSGSGDETVFNRRFDPPTNGSLFGTTTWDQFCAGDGSQEGKILLGLVILLYLVQVIPDTLFAIYNVAGVAGTTFSRMNSLRRVVSNQNEDSITQIWGFKLDRWMNTAYLSALNVIMLYILLMTENVLDIILNALAIMFIHQIDENIANAGWWDGDLRWITAGTLELVIQSIVQTKVLKNPLLLRKQYGITKEDYEKAMGSTSNSLFDSKQADLDEDDPVFNESKARRNVAFFDENRKYFGLIEEMLAKVHFPGAKHLAIFNRYEDYRVWSRWDDILYCGALPDSEFEAKIGESVATTPLADLDPFYTFAKGIILKVLTFYTLFVDTAKEVEFGVNWHLPIRMVFKFMAALIDWFSYFIPLVFPFVVLVSLLFIPICY